MKTFMLTALMLILGVTSIFFFFKAFDAAMEIDSLKTQIQLQRSEMHFMQSIANGSFSACKTSVEDFESVVRANGRDVLWQGDGALVGPFRVKKKDVCIVSINVVAGL